MILFFLTVLHSLPFFPLLEVLSGSLLILTFLAELMVMGSNSINVLMMPKSDQQSPRWVYLYSSEIEHLQKLISHICPQMPPPPTFLLLLNVSILTSFSLPVNHWYLLILIYFVSPPHLYFFAQEDTCPLSGSFPQLALLFVMPTFDVFPMLNLEGISLKCKPYQDILWNGSFQIPY